MKLVLPEDLKKGDIISSVSPFIFGKIPFNDLYVYYRTIENKGHNNPSKKYVMKLKRYGVKTKKFEYLPLNRDCNFTPSALHEWVFTEEEIKLSNL